MTIDDHLDKATILDIEKYHSDVQYLVPTGVKNILVNFGVSPSKVKELGWWDETTITTSPEYLPKDHQLDVIIPSPTFELSDDPPLSPTSTLFSQATLTNDTTITATCCPAQHNSGRGLFHRNQTLWASWYLTCALPEGGEYNVYFGGYVLNFLQGPSEPELMSVIPGTDPLLMVQSALFSKVGPSPLPS